MTDHLKLALPQLATIWLSRDAGLAQVITTIETASKENADLIVFSESFVPGYPFWLDGTGGANFDATCKEKLTKIVAEQDPVKAGRLYLRCPDLSSREDRILLKATRDRAPGYRVSALKRVKRG